jgi:Lon protease-like protein
MSEQHSWASDPLEFPGSAALFPLPNAVFYPGIIFPLHIFEPRYRKMTADALEGNRLIAMALLKPAWEQVPSNTVPPIHDVVCLSKITAEEKLPDGRYYLVLEGLSRARVLGETPTVEPYRIGELELCSDTGQEVSEAEDSRIREQLLRGIEALHSELVVSPMFVQALDRDLPLGVFCDILAHALRLSPLQSQQLLAELNVCRRSQLLLEAIRAELARREKTPLHFPPRFSRN